MRRAKQLEQNILRVFKQLLESTKQYYSRETSIAERQSAIKSEFEHWRSILQAQQTRDVLEPIFRQLSEWAKELPNEAVRTLITSRLEELERIEAKLKRFVPLKDKELEKALKMARQTVLKKNDKATIDSLPASWEELQKQFAALEQEIKSVLAESKNLPRKQKKASRNQMLGRFGLAVFGAILAFGNVLLAMNANLPTETSQASITLGAGCFTKAALKKGN